MKETYITLIRLVVIPCFALVLSSSIPRFFLVSHRSTSAKERFDLGRVYWTTPSFVIMVGFDLGTQYTRIIWCSVLGFTRKRSQP